MKIVSTVDRLTLDNGETLEIIDQSRMVGKDTWLVTLIFRIKMEINEKITEKITSVSENNIRDMIGQTVMYEARHERNFINEHEKDRVLDDLRESFLKTNLKYLSHPDFSLKYVMKKYNDLKKYR